MENEENKDWSPLWLYLSLLAIAIILLSLVAAIFSERDFQLFSRVENLVAAVAGTGATSSPRLLAPYSVTSVKAGAWAKLRGSNLTTDVTIKGAFYPILKPALSDDNQRLDFKIDPRERPGNYQIYVTNAVGKSNTLSFTVLATSSNGVTGPLIIHVDRARGQDSNSGTENSPLQTIARALTIANCGDQIIVEPGNYGNQDPSSKLSLLGRACSASSPLIVKAAGSGVLTNGFSLSASSYVVIDGFEISIPQETTWDIAGVGAGVYISDKSNNITVKNNYIHNTLGPGVFTSRDSSNNLIQNNTIAYAGYSAGLYIYGSNNTIDSNDISHSIQYPLCPKGLVKSPRPGADADGIKIEGVGHIVRNNYIHDLREADAGNECRVNGELYSGPHRDGIQLSSAGASNLTFEKNIIDMSTLYQGYPYCQKADGSDVPHPGEGCWDTSSGVSAVWKAPCGYACYSEGIYISASVGAATSRDIVVRNNVIKSIESIKFANVDGGRIFNNTLVAANPLPAYASITIRQGSKNVQVKNNIIYAVGAAPTKPYLAALTNSSDITAANNIFYRMGNIVKDSSSLVTANNNSNKDPAFSDLSTGDLTLRSGSPAIGTGENLYDAGVRDDRSNKARSSAEPFDLGAYAYVGGPKVIDGGWSDWDEWSACTVSCGGGVQVRARTCTNPKPSALGKPCLGEETERQVCNPQACSFGGGGGGGGGAPVVQVSTSTKTFFAFTPKVSLTKTLSYGSTHREVRTLQDKLKMLGFIKPSLKTTTYFGLTTKNALIKFQKTFRLLPANGILNAKTRLLLNFI